MGGMLLILGFAGFFSIDVAFPLILLLIGGVLAARVALIAEPEGWSPEFGRAVFHANFAEDRDISAWETIGEIVSAIGQDADAVYERAMSADNKGALKKRTERAAKLGIFGAPTFVVGEELFWGEDRLDASLEWAARQTTD